jgi:flavin reductase (DIM6/NTAB) family NADH-FMN oxidoreductase RutF/DNA-binding IclR family transcriptional regulator
MPHIARRPYSPGEEESIDSQYFRRVLGNFPTGVVAVTSIDGDGAPVGMAVGSFTSVSLEPALVAFLPDRSSTTWPRVRESGSFCVNILGSEQETICRALATKGPDKFRDLSWRPSGSGSPIIDGAVAWIDCDIETVHEAGDHYIVIGRVRDLGEVGNALPLLFFRSGYGRFAPLSLSAWDNDLIRPMRVADLARAHMEAASQRLNTECFATAVVEDNLVLIAAAGAIRSRKLVTRVGGRIPFIPPLGTAFIAHESADAREAWLRRSCSQDPDYRAKLMSTLDAVTARGYSVDFGHKWHAEMENLMASAGSHGEGLQQTRDEMIRSIAALPPDFESPGLADPVRHRVGTVNVPVFGPSGEVVMLLSLLGTRLSEEGVSSAVKHLQDTAQRITAELARAGG